MTHIGNKKTLIVSLAALLSSTATVLRAQDQPIREPYQIPQDVDPNEIPVSGWLEEIFQTQVRECNDSTVNIRLKKKGSDNTKPVSFVPNKIVNHLRLEQASTPPYPKKMWVRNGSPIAQEFVFVYEKNNGKYTLSPTRLSVPIDAGNAKTPLPSFSGSRYEVNCALAISYAAKLKGNYGLPFASIEAALSGGASNSRSYTLEFVNGVFYSPLVAMWRGQTPSAPLPAEQLVPGKLYSSLLFWEWLAANKDKSPSILEQMNGIGVFQTQRDQSAQSIATNVKAGLSLPFFSASGEVSGSTSSNSSFNSSSFQVGVFTDDPNPATATTYFELPKLETIKSEASALRPFNLALSAGNGLVIFDSNPIQLPLRAVGMPGRFCARNWTAKDLAGSKGRLTLVSSKPVAGGVEQCEFIVNYYPTTDDIRSGVRLEPEFTIGYDKESLSFRSDPINLSTVNRPRLVPAWTVSPTAALAGSGLGTYSLELEYHIDDENALVAPTKENVSISGLELSCMGTVIAPELSSYDVDQRSWGGRYLKLAISFPASETFLSAARSGSECHVGGAADLKIRTSTGTTTLPRVIPSAAMYLARPPQAGTQ